MITDVNPYVVLIHSHLYQFNFYIPNLFPTQLEFLNFTTSSQTITDVQLLATEISLGLQHHLTFYNPWIDFALQNFQSTCNREPPWTPSTLNSPTLKILSILTHQEIQPKLSMEVGQSKVDKRQTCGWVIQLEIKRKRIQRTGKRIILHHVHAHICYRNFKKSKVLEFNCHQCISHKKSIRSRYVVVFTR